MKQKAFTKSDELQSVVYTHPDGGSVSAKIVKVGHLVYLRYAVPYDGETSATLTHSDADSLSNRVMKTQFIVNAQVAFLRETINHYRHDNRSVELDGGSCLYTPAHSGTEGCAIGRHVPNKKLCLQFDNSFECSVRNPHVFQKIPGQLQALGSDFLGVCQGLHDDGGNWGPHGLSWEGVKTVREICARFNLPEEQVFTI